MCTHSQPDDEKRFIAMEMDKVRQSNNGDHILSMPEGSVL